LNRRRSNNFVEHDLFELSFARRSGLREGGKTASTFSDHALGTTTMASDTKKAKPESAPKSEAVAKDNGPSPEPAVKPAAKPEGGEAAAATPSSYSRGEGQKPVTAAYKENWNAIFAKKKARKKKR
jgi:hypothetical protein